MTKKQAKAHKEAYNKAVDEGRVLRIEGACTQSFHTLHSAFAAERAMADYKAQGFTVVIVRR